MLCLGTPIYGGTSRPGWQEAPSTWMYVPAIDRSAQTQHLHRQIEFRNENVKI